MMKKILLLLIGMLLFSCDNNDVVDPIPEKKNYVEIEIYYTTESNGTLYPDVDSRIFVYYGIFTSEISGYEVGEDGVLTKRTHTITPDDSYITDFEGKCKFQTEDEEAKITIIIFSNYRDRITHNSWYGSKEGISYKVIINP